MKLLPALALAALLASGGCKKDAPEASLPPATQTGANTAGCLINGQPFIAKAYGGGILSSPIPALNVGLFDSLYYLSMSGLYKGRGVSVELFLRRPEVGTFLLNRDTQYYPKGSALYVLNHATYKLNDTYDEVYVTDAHHIGEVVFTKLNKSVFLAAGTFSFEAANTRDPTQVITIANGRFDVKQ